MSDPQRFEPSADDEPVRMYLDDGRLRIDSGGVTINVPLAQIEHYMVWETPSPDAFDVRVCLGIRVNEVVMRHRGNPSGFEAIRRAWETARGQATVEQAPLETPSDHSRIQSVPLMVVEPTPVEVTPPPRIGGPAMLDDGPDWLMFGPLPDTRLLSEADLLVPDVHPGTGT